MRLGGVATVVLGALCVSTGCDSGEGGAARGGDGGVVCDAGGTEWTCNGSTATRCRADGTSGMRRDCTARDQVCVPGKGCVACRPERGRCRDNKVMVCREDGSGFEEVETCGSQEVCDPVARTCDSPCKEAVAAGAYIGCEYWPVVTSNSDLPSEFTFAVAVANPRDRDADIRIERDGNLVTEATVSPDELEVLELPWVDDLKNEFSKERSALVRGGAYRLTSTVPVSVYQLNPLNFQLEQDCDGEAQRGQPEDDGQCFSFSNDASLLLPTHVLTGNYMALSRRSQITKVDLEGSRTLYRTSPGFVAVVGVEESDVEVQLTGRVRSSADGTVTSLDAGETASWHLTRGDVLQLVTPTPEQCSGGPTEDLDQGRQATYCNVGESLDLTGTEIRATGKVAVVSGHNCTFVPSDRWACDHLEEQMFPLETWGQRMIVSATKSLRGEPNFVRLVSGADGNQISFEPSSVHAPVTLGRGEMLEFQTDDHVVVEGQEALMAGQFLVGQDWKGFGSAGPNAEGDPSMSLAIPVEQFRDRYTFLAPRTFTRNYVNVMVAGERDVSLDGSPVDGWRSVGASDVRVAQVEISGGTHELMSSGDFGIVVYGFGLFTSYMYPGGLDLEEINPVL